MTTVAEILKSKADPAVYAAAPSDTVYSALRLMGNGFLSLCSENHLPASATSYVFMSALTIPGTSNSSRG